MISATAARHVAFVLRCTAGAASAYGLADGIGLPHPAWAAISATVVAQERLGETHGAVIGRSIGTAVGVLTAVLVGLAVAPFTAGTVLPMALSVAVTAALVRVWPRLRVAMWTSSVVFLTAVPGETLVETGLWRGAEVLLGSLVGLALHFAVDACLRRCGWLDGNGRGG